MNEFVKGALVVLVLLYLVDPVDFCPGPIDDVVVALLGYASCKHLPAFFDSGEED